MRIRCTSLDDFWANLHGTQGIYRESVWCDVTRIPIAHTGGRPNAWEVNFQASAIIEDLDGSQSLVECGLMTGVVNTARDGTTEGQDKADALREDLRGRCEAAGWCLRPGMLDA
jgi:hypothetical protein